jgi:hypothetical protein
MFDKTSISNTQALKAQADAQYWHDFVLGEIPDLREETDVRSHFRVSRSRSKYDGIELLQEERKRLPSRFSRVAHEFFYRRVDMDHGDFHTQDLAQQSGDIFRERIVGIDKENLAMFRLRSHFEHCRILDGGFLCKKNFLNEYPESQGMESSSSPGWSPMFALTEMEALELSDLWMYLQAILLRDQPDMDPDSIDRGTMRMRFLK